MTPIDGDSFPILHTISNLQPSLDLLLGVSKRVLVAILLAPDLIRILLGNISRLCSWVVVPGRALLDFLIRKSLVHLAVRPLVNIDHDSAAETKIVLQRYVGLNEAVVCPP